MLLILHCFQAIKVVQALTAVLVGVGALSQAGGGLAIWVTCNLVLAFVWPQVGGKGSLGGGLQGLGV